MIKNGDEKMIYGVTVIGGGSSGLMAALSAAEQGAQTLLLEKGRKLGTKLLISGGGRCNVTNRLPQDEVIKNIPGNGSFLYSAFSIFDNYDIIDFFEGLNVPLKEEDHGRMFPASDSARSVVDTLVNELKRLEVEIRLESPVKSIEYGQEFHTLELTNGQKVKTKTLIIAVGGKSVPHTGSTGDGYQWAKDSGHRITELYPTEVALTSNERFIQEKTLQGLSLRDVALSVLDAKGQTLITHQMDMIFTHFGVSGPAVLRCSQFAVKEFLKGEKQVELRLDLLPELNEETLTKDLLAQIDAHPKRSFKNTLKGLVPERFIEFLITKYQLEEIKNANLPHKKVRLLISDLKRFTFTVDDSLSIEKAFVTGGGIDTKEIDPRTMASKKTDRLFFAGEILNIHGYTGGYNITAALITGRLAGINASYLSY